MKKAWTGVVVAKVSENRRASALSLLKLEREISSQVSENEAMCTRSKADAATMSIR